MIASAHGVESRNPRGSSFKSGVAQRVVQSLLLLVTGRELFVVGGVVDQARGPAGFDISA